MKASVLKFLPDDLTGPWGPWAKISVATSASWLALWAYVDLTGSLLVVGGTIEFPLAWVAIVSGVIALVHKRSSKIAVLSVLSGMVVIITLGWPILLLTFVWVPVLLLDAVSPRQLTSSTLSFSSLMVLFWIVAGLAFAAVVAIMRLRK